MIFLVFVLFHRWDEILDLVNGDHLLAQVLDPHGAVI